MSDMPYDLHFHRNDGHASSRGIEMAELVQTKAQSAKAKAFATKTAADPE
jgi:hypothetical protein